MSVTVQVQLAIHKELVIVRKGLIKERVREAERKKKWL